MLIAALCFIVLMIIGVPIALVLGIMGSVHTITLGNPTYLLVIIQRLFDQINHHIPNLYSLLHPGRRDYERRPA